MMEVPARTDIVRLRGAAERLLRLAVDLGEARNFGRRGLGDLVEDGREALAVAAPRRCASPKQVRLQSYQ